MAGRPRKKTVEYFAHYTNASDSSRTLAILQHSYGNDGYAAWFKILERLGASDGHYYSCQESVAWEFLVAKLGITSISATEIINTMAKLDAIDRELWDKKVIWCQKFVDGLAEVYRKRDQPIPQKPIIDSNNTPSAPISATEITQDTPISATENTQRKIDSKDSKDSKDSNSVTEIKNDGRKVYYHYEKNIGQITSHISEVIKDAQSIYPEEWIIEAINIAVERNTRKWSYIDGILKNWQANGKNNNGHSKQRTIPLSAYEIVENPKKKELLNGKNTPVQ